MLHHLSLAVIDLARASAFYDAVLAPLGYVRVFADDEAVGELAHLDLPRPAMGALGVDSAHRQVSRGWLRHRAAIGRPDRAT